MKKLLVLLSISCSIIFSCENDIDVKSDSNIETLQKKTVTGASASKLMSVGEQHNYYLDELYNHLKSQSDLSLSNIDQYSHDYFSTIEFGEEASKQYNFVKSQGSYASQFSDDFNAEIQNFRTVLENSDFKDMEEFKSFADNYSVKYIESDNDLTAWKYYKDVFVSSFEYWSVNIENWYELIPSSDTTGKGYPICQIYVSWWKRAFCNVINFVGMDAAAAAGNVLGSLITGNPVVIGVVAVAALGGSANSVINNLGE